MSIMSETKEDKEGEENEDEKENTNRKRISFELVQLKEDF